MKGERWLLLLILAASMALNLVGITFTQPRHWDPSVDSLHPVFSLDAMDHAFDQRSTLSVKYPRLHYVVTGVIEHLVLVVRHGPAEARRIHDELLSHTETTQLHGDAMRESYRPWSDDLGAMIVAGRVVSAVMGTLLVLAMFLFARALFQGAEGAEGARAACGAGGVGSVAGLMSAALCATSYPFVFYAHTLNVDTPYLCFAVFALHAAVRAVRHIHVTRWIVQAGVFAALSIATKDQAAGIFVLTIPLTAILLVLPGPLGGHAQRRLALRGLGIAALASGVLYLLLIGVPYDMEGVRAHFEHIFGEGVKPFRQAPDPVTLLVDTGRQIVDATGWLMLLLAGVGAVTAWRWSWRAALLLVVPAVSTYLTFIAPIGYCYQRFTMPILLMLFVLASVVPAALIGVKSSGWFGRGVGIVLLAAVLAPSAIRSIEVVRMLRADTRDRATGWMAANILDDEKVAVFRDIPRHNIELPGNAQVRVLTAEHPTLPPGFGLPDVVLISLFDPIRAGSGHVEPRLPITPRRTFFGNTYVLDATIEPLFEHPIRHSVAFQPTVVAYRRLAAP